MNGPRSMCSRTAARGWSPVPGGGAESAVGGGERSDGHRARRAAQAHDREHRTCFATSGPRTTSRSPASSRISPTSRSSRSRCRSPCPIWLATNAERLSNGQSRFRRVGVRAHARRQDRRRLDDRIRSARKVPALMGFHPAGRPRPAAATCRGFDNVLYHHINVNDDKERGARRIRRRSSTSIIPPTTARSAWNPG